MTDATTHPNQTRTSVAPSSYLYALRRVVGDHTRERNARWYAAATYRRAIAVPADGEAFAKRGEALDEVGPLGYLEALLRLTHADPVEALA